MPCRQLGPRTSRRHDCNRRHLPNVVQFLAPEDDDIARLILQGVSVGLIAAAETPARVTACLLDIRNFSHIYHMYIYIYTYADIYRHRYRYRY